MEGSVNIFWFRRDLRLHDNAGLTHALKSGRPIVPIFIFDKNILDDLEDKADRRVDFIHGALCEMQAQLQKMESSLEVYYGFPTEVFQNLLKKHKVLTVFTNHDYEPYAKKRDADISEIVKLAGASFETFKDQVIFEKEEVMKDDGSPYTVYSPYARRWLARLDDSHMQPYPVYKYFHNFYKQSTQAIPSLSSMGFVKVNKPFPEKELEDTLISKYAGERNFPGKGGTSRLGIHLRFGTVSIREIAQKAMAHSESFLNELTWREFYQMILWNFPRVGEGKAFKPEFDNIPWRNNENEFKRWCDGSTGYPIVDAGIRELNETGFMHNRVRMIVASFLTKHLLIDWRWGEAYFAQKLLDFDFASNNGGWQWASGSGCDAAPYFRIFNPAIQTRKFDAGLEYIRKWVPGFQELTYPKPMVDHDFARKRCLEVYGKAVRSLRV